MSLRAVTSIPTTDTTYPQQDSPQLGIPAKDPILEDILNENQEWQTTPRRDSLTSSSGSMPPSPVKKSTSTARGWWNSSGSSGMGSTHTTPEKKEKAKEFETSSPLKESTSSGRGWWNSSGSSGMGSTHTTPEKKEKPEEFETPSPIKQARSVIEQNSPTSDLTVSERVSFDDGIVAIEGLESPHKSKQKGKIQTLVFDALKKKGGVAPISPLNLSKAFDECKEDADEENLSGKVSVAAENYDELRDWFKSALQITELKLIDRTHHAKFKNESGKHIYFPGDPLDPKIIERRINRETGVWCGSIVTGNLEKKFSTFIPLDMKEMDYYNLLNVAIENKDQEIAQHDNRKLYKIVDGERTFFVEVLFQLDGKVIRSSYPILHFEKYTLSEKRNFEIKFDFHEKFDETKFKRVLFEIPYDIIIRKYLDLKDKVPVIRYQTSNTLIIDIGILFADLPEAADLPHNGIYIEFPKEVLQKKET